jgi:hypothetical protein
MEQHLGLLIGLLGIRIIHLLAFGGSLVSQMGTTQISFLRLVKKDINGFFFFLTLLEHIFSLSLSLFVS